MAKESPFTHTKTIVDMLRQISKDIARSKQIDTVTIPLTASLNDTYPMGIKPGDYSRKELSDAIHFIADMME